MPDVNDVYLGNPCGTLPSAVFQETELPQNEREHMSYDLIRGLLAAHARECSFCLLANARRRDLIEIWYEP